MPYALGDFPDPETVAIEFEGRRFVWHANPPQDGEEFFPTVTTTIEDANDYAAERLAMERFLSGLSFMTRKKIEVVTAGGAGMPAEFDPPVVKHPRRGLATRMEEAPRELVVAEDDRDRLRLVLGYSREGFNTASPYFKFLAFWNALEVACEDYPGGMRAWLGERMAEHPYLRGGDLPPPDDWWDYLFEERRSAIAHAVREPGRAEDLDPDDPDMQGRFGTDARLLDDLVHMRVQERWGQHAVMRLRRREILDGPR